MKKVKRIWNIITICLVSILVVLAILLVGAKIFGLEAYSVLSGSMETTYPTGSLIYVKKTPAKEVQIGDVITFVMNEDLTVATHRVIEIDQENQLFYTKGDMNDAPDGEPVLFDNLIGVPVLMIPYVGSIANFVKSPPGLYLVVAVGALLVVLLLLPELFKKTEYHQKSPAPPAVDSTE